MAKNPALVAMEDARRKANLRVLQRIDSSIVDIIGSATHVVLYEFRNDRQEWDKINVEGSLFVVGGRLSDDNYDPSFARTKNEAEEGNNKYRYKLIILNRMSTENTEIPMNSNFQMQLREPYLIFRLQNRQSSTPLTDNPVIRGIWFHSAEERTQVHALLEKLVKNKEHVANLGQKDSGGIKAVSDVIDVKEQGTMADKEAEFAPRKSETWSESQGISSKTAEEARAALLSALSISDSVPKTFAISTQNQDVKESASASAEPSELVLDRKTLQLTLLSLIQDDRFIDLIHAQYLRVARTRAHASRQAIDDISSDVDNGSEIKR